MNIQGLCLPGMAKMPTWGHSKLMKPIVTSRRVGIYSYERRKACFTVYKKSFISCQAVAAGKRGRGRRKADKEVEGVPTFDAPPLPAPQRFQQTVQRSFTIGGIGLHTAKQSYVRVRPAPAGTGRFFVIVPPGTNSERFVMEAPNNLVKGSDLAHLAPGTEAEEDFKVEMYQRFLLAQEEEGYKGTLIEFMTEQTESINDSALFVQPQDSSAEDTVPVGPQPGEIIIPANLDALEIIQLQKEAENGSLSEDLHTRLQKSSELCRFLHILQRNNSSSEIKGKVLSALPLLAALENSGVDNARIEIEGGSEVPIMDGSAQGWCVEAQVARLQPAPAKEGTPILIVASEKELEEQDDNVTLRERTVNALPRTTPVLSSPIIIQEGDAMIALHPGPVPRISIGLDDPEVDVIGKQWFTWSPETDNHFRWEIAPARLYFRSLEELSWASGYDENMYQSNPQKWLMLRMKEVLRQFSSREKYDDHIVKQIPSKYEKKWRLENPYPENEEQRLMVENWEDYDEFSLVKAGHDDAALVAMGDLWEDMMIVRFPENEPARYDAQLLLGLLSLLAQPGGRGLPKGHIVSYKSSVDMMIKFVAAIARALDSQEEGRYEEIPLLNASEK